MQVAELTAVISADTSGFTAQLGAAEAGLRRFSGAVDNQTSKAASSFTGHLDRMGAAAGALSGAGSALTLGLTLPLGALGIASVKAAGDMQALRLGLQAVTETQLRELGVPALEATARAATETTARLKVLEEIAKLPGLGFEDAVKGDLRLRNAGLSAEQSAKSLREFGNAIARAGGGKEQLDRVTLALSQIVTKGKVSQEEINQLTEAGIVLGPIMKKAFGTADTQELQKAGVNATQFVDAITAELARLPRVTGGINNSFENASGAATKALSNVGLALENTFSVSGLLDGFSDALENVSARFEALSPATQKSVFALGGLVLVVGPVLATFGAIGAAIPALVAGLGTVGAAVGLAAGPFALLVVAVGAAAVAIVTHWDDIVSYFQGPDGQVFRELGRAVGEAVSGIRAAFAELNSGANFADLISASGLVGTLIQGIGTGITAVLDTINGLVRAVSALFEGDWARAFDGAKQAVNGLLGPIANVLGLDYSRLREFLGVVGDGPVEGVSVLTNSFIGLNQGLAGYVEVAGQAAAAGTKLAATPPPVDPVALKAVEDMRKALEDLYNGLRLNGELSEALGRNYDYLGERQKTLESGIVSLVKAGFDPAGRTVQGFVAELQRLKNAYDDLSRIELKLPAGVSAPKVEAPQQAFAVDFSALPAALPTLDIAPFTTPLTEASAQLAQFQLTAETFSAGLSNILVAGITDVAVGFGEALGQIVTGASSLNALPAIVLGALGGLAIQVGQLAIGTGLAVLGIKQALTSLNPVAAIAGGVALVALGTIVKGVASKLGSGGGGGSVSLPGGAGAGPSASVAPSPTARPEPLRIELNLQPVEIRQKGPDLAGVLALDSYRRRRAG